MKRSRSCWLGGEPARPAGPVRDRPAEPENRLRGRQPVETVDPARRLRDGTLLVT
jgi:hypothetical protein